MTNPFERSKTAAPTEYIYGPTEIIAIKTPASMFYVIKNRVDSIRVFNPALWHLNPQESESRSVILIMEKLTEDRP